VENFPPREEGKSRDIAAKKLVNGGSVTGGTPASGATGGRRVKMQG